MTPLPVYEVAPRSEPPERPERPTFLTNIFDEREESEPELQQEQESFDAHHWFWFSIVIAIFCLGVAASYYIIHYF